MMGHKYKVFMRFIGILFVLGIAACTTLIPATTPPQLEATAGAFISLDDEVFDAGNFRVNYPDGWRIVKISVATAPLEVVFAAPDNEMTIRILEGLHDFPENTPDPTRYMRHDQHDLSPDVSVTIIGQAPIAAQETLDRIFEAVLESLLLGR
ncbi:MAG: hypothetical protein Q9P01_02420 [Anaerolineae bacterium]|nr:hypothetical protein [Anaerolineae bacterium]MDQ7033712.1 hypothetical protein [Anaerolineae bacterium]